MESDNAETIDRIEEEINQLQQAALDLLKSKQRLEIGAAEYSAKVKEYREHMQELEKQRNSLQEEGLQNKEVRAWLDTFAEHTLHPDSFTSFDGMTMKMLVERIIAKEKGLEVVFKCGVVIEKEFVK